MQAAERKVSTDHKAEHEDPGTHAVLHRDSLLEDHEAQQQRHRLPRGGGDGRVQRAKPLRQGGRAAPAHETGPAEHHDGRHRFQALQQQKNRRSLFKRVLPLTLKLRGEHSK